MSKVIEFANSDSSCSTDNSISEDVLPSILNEDSSLNSNLARIKTCSRWCKQNCDDKIDSLSEEDKNLIHESIQGRKIEIKNKLIQHLNFQRKAGLSTNVFIFLNHEFCSKAFASFVKLSIYTINTVISDFHKSVRSYIHGNANIPTESLKVTRCISWL